MNPVLLQLKEAGYTNVDALDPNKAMLDEAKKLNVYHNFIVDFLTKKKLDVEEGLILKGYEWICLQNIICFAYKVPSFIREK